MDGQAVILTPVALMLAGSVCLAWSSAATGRSQRRRLLATDVLWVIAGLLSLGTVAIAIVHMVTQPLVGTAIGDWIAALFIGAVGALTVFGLLGYIGFWARLRDHGRTPAPDTRSLSPMPRDDN